MSKFMDSRYNSLKEYTPGEQPQDKSYIKLNTNESPFPPSPSVIVAVNQQAVERLCLYSDPTANNLKKAIANLYGVGKDNVFVSNGSDEILNFSFMLYGNVNGAIFPDITYGFYKVFADLYGIDYKLSPLNDDYSVNVKDFMNTGKLTVLANPNAPTGIALPIETIEEIVKSNKDNVVIIDEAYVDFGGESAIRLIDKYDNLIVCQTFSKSRSMAGARLGFCFASKDIIADLERIKYSTNPYNINSLTQIAGIAAIGQNDYYLDNAKKIIENREYTVRELKKLGFDVLDSKANFVFAKSQKIGGEELYLKLKEKGVLVRHFDNSRICEYNRITIGSFLEMSKFISAVKSILEEIK